jgi:hypothetical protein
MPIESTKLHCDLTGLLVIITFHLGSFEQGLQDIFATSTEPSRLTFIQTRSVMQKEPMFITYTIGHDAPSPMTSQDWIDYMRTLCISAGLIGYFTSHAFRRVALATIQEKLGTKTAQRIGI